MSKRTGWSLEQSWIIQRVALVLLLVMSLPSVTLGFEDQISGAVVELGTQIAAANLTKLTVVDFTDSSGGVTELGRFLAEEVSAALVESGSGFQVIDRIHLKSILKEHELDSTGLIDPDTAREIGKIAGVQALITGTLTPLGESVRLAIKVLDTNTALVLGAKRVNLPKTEAIAALLEQEVSSPAGYSSSTAKPQDRLVGHQPEQSQETGSFLFELISCKRSKKHVRCSLRITNNGRDRELGLYPGSSRLYDNFGKEYRGIEAGLGEFSGNSARKMMIVGIPIAAHISFDSFSEAATSISKLDINNNGGHLEFRNISFTP